MMDNNKFGVMTYNHKDDYNIGDYIQSLAAEQYLPNVDEYIEREGLNSYKGDKVKMIMNGWYMHNPDNFPPVENIDPLFISFHLNSYVKDKFLNEANVSYLKRHQPIGCRDLHTKRVLEAKGIEAYHSGCLTTTLDLKYKSDVNTGEIYFADPLFNIPNLDSLTTTPNKFVKGVLSGDIFKIAKRSNLMSKLFSQSIIDKAQFIAHKYPSTHSNDERFQIARETLNKFATAKLVITSRIHAALPCLALGTPVIFINYGSFDANDLCRFEGIVDLFNTINIGIDGSIKANFELPASGLITENFNLKNPDRYLAHAPSLKESCRNFISQG